MTASFKIEPAWVSFSLPIHPHSILVWNKKKNCCLILSGSQKKQQQQKQSRIMTIKKKNSFPFVVFWTL